jgi:CDP-glucose 4,6-dehydratase
MEGLAMNPDFWKGRKVFVTGHTGFKGSWLSLWLQMLGSEVYGYSLPPETTPNLFDLAEVADGMHSKFGDVRNLTTLQGTLKKVKPEIVFHLAAQPLVRTSYDDPVRTYSTNVMGTVNLLEALRNTQNVRAIVNVTTDKVYENRNWDRGYRESDGLGGYDPYSNSKSSSELVTSAYRNSYFNQENYKSHGVALATARAGNVIGGGDWAKDRLIPDLLRALQFKEIAQIRSPSAIRPWQHVLEPLRGYLMLAESLFIDGPKYGEAWNFGPEVNDSKTVQWIANELTKIWGKEGSWINNPDENYHETQYLKLDISKAKIQLGWVPIVPLTEGLLYTVDWVQKYLGGKNARHITLSQIKDYQALIANSKFNEKPQ